MVSETKSIVWETESTVSEGETAVWETDSTVSLAQIVVSASETIGAPSGLL